jgi:6-pyruvoyltetrahydropterin/6-carboxytetrahydropterin synthase
LNITKTMEFDAGHRLLHDNGLCCNLHGHRYRLEVEVSAKWDGGNTGTVLNFRDLKQVMSDYVVGDFDHSLILHPGDNELLSFVSRRAWRYNLMPEAMPEPTAENMAMHFWHLLEPALRAEIDPAVTIEKITLWETPTCMATIRREDVHPTDDCEE